MKVAALNIRGSICALATPFQAGGALDLDAFARLLDYQIDGGTQALVVAGSTGEAHFLEADEYARLLAHAVEQVAGRVPVIAGTGEAGTARTIALTRQAASLGVDAALVVTPFYVRPTQDGLHRHFTEVADHGGLPLILYNVPSRSGCDLLPATVAALSGHPQIIGLKDARADAERIDANAQLADAGFAYFCGDDGNAARAMLAGAAGTISVVVNVVPQAFRALCDAACAGDAAATGQRLAALQPLLHALEAAPNPITVKAALAALGIGDGSLRLPLMALRDHDAMESLRHALAQLAPLPSAA